MSKSKTNKDLLKKSSKKNTKTNFSSPGDFSKRKEFMFLTKIPKQEIEIIEEVEENNSRNKFLKLNYFIISCET